MNFRSTSGPVIAKAGDLAAQLTNLDERDVLFIDEIHRLNPAVEEILYPAMEDYQLDLIIGEGPAARSVKIELAEIHLVGATTRAGLLTTPLRDRFGIPIRLEFYEIDELEKIVARGRGARARHVGRGRQRDRQARPRHAAHRRPPAAPGAGLRHRRRGGDRHPRHRRPGAQAPRRGRGRPRRDGPEIPDADRLLLRRGPVGIETIGAALSEPRDAIEDIVEPFLIQKGFVQRTPRGRVLTRHAFRHLGLAEPRRDPASQFGLFPTGEDA